MFAGCEPRLLTPSRATWVYLLWVAYLGNHAGEPHFLIASNFSHRFSFATHHPAASPATERRPTTRTSIPPFLFISLLFFSVWSPMSLAPPDRSSWSCWLPSLTSL